MIELKTRWTESVNPDCPLPEYPRPQLVRDDWQNLNGRYEYAITGKNEKRRGKEAASKIKCVCGKHSKIRCVQKS